MPLSRRRLLSLIPAFPFQRAALSGSPLPVGQVQQMRSSVEELLDGRYIALELRALDSKREELFRIQFNADMLLPVASCFKAFVVPWYYLTVPREDWNDGPDSAVWNMAVHSNNYYTAVALDRVAALVPGEGNAIEKFNDFLLSIGMQNGIHLWRIGPTKGQIDERFRPSRASGRMVRLGDRQIPVFNTFSAADLATGYDFIARGERFSPGPGIGAALQRTRELLAIPEKGVNSPIERVYRPGYIGKQGSIPPQDIPTGYVFNDAGLIRIGDLQYILAFMSVSEFESRALAALRAIVGQAILLEREFRRLQQPPRRLPHIHG